jgi:sulfide:quinone oxidoreductase
MKKVIPSGVKWIKEYVASIEASENKLTLKDGTEVNYEYLVASPGVQINLDDVPGLKEALGTDSVCSVYTDANHTWEVLQNFKGGNALFTQAATPIKCGGAPQKVMYLSDDYFRKSGVREKTNMIFAIPGSVIFGTEPFKSTLEGVVDRKDLYLRFFHKLTRVDGKNKIAYYKITKFVDQPEKIVRNPRAVGIQVLSESEVAIPFDMMHLAPPQSAPDFIRNSELAVQEGPNKGWIDVNINSMQHNRFNNVFALGDAAALPTAKTGAAIRKQAPVLVANLYNLIEGKPITDLAYDGYSSCPIVTGYGKMLLAEFDYTNERNSDPIITKFVDTSKEQYSMWLLKKYGLPFMYWNLMLKGRA